MIRLYEQGLLVAPFIIAPTPNKEAALVFGNRELGRAGDWVATLIDRGLARSRPGLAFVAQHLGLDHFSIAAATIQTAARDDAGREGLQITYGVIVPERVLHHFPTVIPESMARLKAFLEDAFEVQLDREGSTTIVEVLLRPGADQARLSSLVSELLDWFENQYGLAPYDERTGSEKLSAASGASRRKFIRRTDLQSFATVDEMQNYWNSLADATVPSIPTERGAYLRRLTVPGPAASAGERASRSAVLLSAMLIVIAAFWDAPQELRMTSDVIWISVRGLVCALIALAGAEEFFRWVRAAHHRHSTTPGAVQTYQSGNMRHALIILMMLAVVIFGGVMLFGISVAAILPYVWLGSSSA